MSNRKRSNMQQARPQLPPIINEDDGELPFFKQDFFSDVALIISGKKLYTARCILAYNSPVFEKMMGNAKKHEIDLSNKNFDDIVELMCFLDPRVPYTVTDIYIKCRISSSAVLDPTSTINVKPETLPLPINDLRMCRLILLCSGHKSSVTCHQQAKAQSAKQLLPLSEEYEMHKLRKQCENILYSTYISLRKKHRIGTIPFETNEEYLLLADRYGMYDLIQMCVDEYVSNSDVAAAKVAVNSDTLSEKVKLLILRKKLAMLNSHLEKERRYRAEAEMKASRLQPTTNWKKYWHTDEGPVVHHTSGR